MKLWSEVSFIGKGVLNSMRVRKTRGDTESSIRAADCCKPFIPAVLNKQLYISCYYRKTTTNSHAFLLDYLVMLLNRPPSGQKLTLFKHPHMLTLIFLYYILKWNSIPRISSPCSWQLILFWSTHYNYLLLLLGYVISPWIEHPEFIVGCLLHSPLHLHVALMSAWEGV